MEGTIVTRRQFLERSLVVGAGLVMLPRVGVSRVLAAQTQIPLAGSSIPQFVDPLPSVDVIQAGASQIELRMTEFRTQVLPSGFPPTWVWGYLQPGQTARPSYLGPVIVATRGTPTEIKWVNVLGNTADSKVLAWTTSTDQTLHWADPLNGEANECAESVEPAQPPVGDCAKHYDGSIPAVAHLHGGEVPPVLDGGPDAWFTSDGAYKGHAFYSRDGTAATNHAIYRYPNVQEAAPIWFHDHTLGLTRLGVYAGLAGGYLIIDPGSPGSSEPAGADPTGDPGPHVRHDGPAVLSGGHPFHPEPRASLLGTGVHRRHHRRQRQGLAVPRGRAEALPVPLPQRLQRPRHTRCSWSTATRRFRGPALWQIGTDGGYLERRSRSIPTRPGANSSIWSSCPASAPT